MQDFKRKRFVRQMFFSYVTIALLLLVVGLLSVSVFHRFTIEREMAARKDESESELRELRLRAQALESEVRYLEDDRGVEAEIRNRFDVAKEGEQVVIIVDDTSDTDVIEPLVPATHSTTTPPWYKFWR